MGEPTYRVPGENFEFAPEVIEAAHAESVSLFDVEPGSRLELDLSFDKDGGKTARMLLGIDRPAQRTDWDRGSFTVLEIDLTFESPIADFIGRTGSIDSAVTYRPDYMPPIGLAKISHVSIGRSLIMNFDIPDVPDRVNRLIPLVMDYKLIPPAEEEIPTEAQDGHDINLHAN